MMKTKPTAGYSLPELLMILAMSAILSISTLTGWQHWQQQQRLNETAWQIQSFLYGVRRHAYIHNSDQTLWINTHHPPCLGSGPEPVAGCESGQRLHLLLPWPEIKLLQLIGEPGFYGQRNVAKPGSVVFGNQDIQWRVVISSRGRIRLCKPEWVLCQ